MWGDFGAAARRSTTWARLSSPWAEVRLWELGEHPCCPHTRENSPTAFPSGWFVEGIFQVCEQKTAPSPALSPALCSPLLLQQPLLADGCGGTVIQAQTVCGSWEISRTTPRSGVAGWASLGQALGLQCGRVCPHVPSFLGRPTPPSKSLLLAGRSGLWPEAAGPGPRKHAITEQGVGGIPGETPGSPGSPCSLGPPEPNSFSLLTSRDGGLTLCEGGPCLVG